MCQHSNIRFVYSISRYQKGESNIILNTSHSSLEKGRSTFRSAKSRVIYFWSATNQPSRHSKSIMVEALEQLFPVFFSFFTENIRVPHKIWSKAAFRSERVQPEFRNSGQIATDEGCSWTQVWFCFNGSIHVLYISRTKWKKKGGNLILQFFLFWPLYKKEALALWHHLSRTQKRRLTKEHY